MKSAVDCQQVPVKIGRLGIQLFQLPVPGGRYVYQSGCLQGFSMVIVAAKLIFTSREDRDKAVELSIPIQQATREQEAGCHAYCFAADPCDPVAIQVYELWEDSESLVAHFDHENYHAMLELSSQVGLVESINRAYLTEKDEPVYGPGFEKKTSFFT